MDIFEIRESLSGIARVIEYTIEGEELQADQLPNSKQMKITSVIEGEMKQGHFEGFSRSIDSEGRCTAGFYSTILSQRLRGGKKAQNSTIMSRPYGKWVEYSQDGFEIHTAGLYRGDEKEWDRLIKQQPITDFTENEEPVLTLA